MFDGHVVFKAMQDYYHKTGLKSKLARKSFWCLQDKTQRKYSLIHKTCCDYGLPIGVYVETLGSITEKPANKLTINDFANKGNIKECLAFYNKYLHPSVVYNTEEKALVNYVKKLVPSVYEKPDDILFDIHMPFVMWYRLLRPKADPPSVLAEYGLPVILEDINKDYNLAKFIDTCPAFVRTKQRINLNLKLWYNDDVH